MGKKNEVAKTEGTVLSTAVATALEQYEGAGQEDFTAGDLQLPFLYLLQDLSPQVKKRDPKYIDGAEPGDFLHSVVQSPIDGEIGIPVLPIGYNKVFNEWVPRKEGGGFVASHPSRDEAYTNRIAGNDVVETANWFLLAKINGNWAPIVLSCTSTKLKASRNLASRINLLRVEVGGESRRVPIFMQQYTLKALAQSNQHGAYFAIQFVPDGILDDDDLIAEGANLRELFKGGKLGLDFNKTGEGTTTTPDDDDDDDQF